MRRSVEQPTLDELELALVGVADPPTAADDAELDPYPGPVPTEAKVRPGHRGHSAFRSIRFYSTAGDTICAAVALLIMLVFTNNITSLTPYAWLGLMMIRTSLGDRMGDLLDRRPFLRTNAHFALAATVFSVVFGTTHSTRVLLVTCAFLVASGLGVRTLLRFISTSRSWGPVLCETVLLVGSRDDVRRTLAEWRDLPSVDVVGVCLAAADSGVSEVDGVPVLGLVPDVAEVARELGADVVALHDVDRLGGLQLARLQYVLEEVGTQLSVITPLTNMRADRASVRRHGRRVVVDISYGTPKGVIRLCKTVVDQIASLILIVVTAPIMLTAGILIRLTSPGPMIFKQVRVGEGGTTFVMYKLRTMVVDAEDRLESLLKLNEVGGGLFKLTDDPRMTRVGRWLRTTSIDELPQLFNVLKGEMSLIGPRPALPHEVQTYDDVAKRRLAVKPGITGLWQVSGRSNLSWDETVRIDSDYVNNWRAGRELSIAMRTVTAVILRRGAR